VYFDAASRASQFEGTFTPVAEGPVIDLEKFVNGQDANTCPGVTVPANSTLTYQYKVTNTGNTVLVNLDVTDNLLGAVGTIARLDPGQSQSLTQTAIAPASGQRQNVGTVVGTPADASGTPLVGINPVTATDPACATVAQPAITLQKLVNGDDANTCPGVTVPPNSTLTYQYKVTNTGNTVLVNLAVTDDLLGTIGTIARLNAGQISTLTKTATAPASGQRQNVGSVVGTPADATGTPLVGVNPVTATDPACATVGQPAIALQKLVNGNDANTCPGLMVAPNASLTYEYRVSNTGNTVLVNLAVTDNLLGSIGTIPRLDPGQNSSLFRSTTGPTSGQRQNIGSVSGTAADSSGGALPSVPPVSAQDSACVSIPPSP
jgi:predicted nucleic acid-binding Zn ribbon protein